MKLKRLLFPLVVVVVAVVAVSATVGLISAAYYVPNVLEPPRETEGTPQEPELSQLPRLCLRQLLKYQT